MCDSICFFNTVIFMSHQEVCRINLFNEFYDPLSTSGLLIASFPIYSEDRRYEATPLLCQIIYFWFKIWNLFSSNPELIERVLFKIDKYNFTCRHFLYLRKMGWCVCICIHKCGYNVYFWISKRYIIPYRNENFQQHAVVNIQKKIVV